MSNLAQTIKSILESPISPHRQLEVIKQVMFAYEDEPTPLKAPPMMDLVNENGAQACDMATVGTGAKRSKLLAEEVRFDLLDSNDSAMRRLAKVFALGFKKYGPDNWKKGFPNSEYYAHAREHMLKWIEAEPWNCGPLPEDDLAHAVWNLCAIMWNEEHLPEMCDFPPQQKS